MAAVDDTLQLDPRILAGIVVFGFLAVVAQVLKAVGR